MNSEMKSEMKSEMNSDGLNAKTKAVYRWIDDVSEDYSQDSLCGYIPTEHPYIKKKDGDIIQVQWPEANENGETFKYPARKETHKVLNRVPKSH